MGDNSLIKWYEKLWIYNFYKECQTWREVRRVYKKNRKKFESVGLKSDWFGRMYRVINRDVRVELGSDEDEILLHKDLEEITNILVETNIMDILAYELKPLEEDNGKTYEHGYLILFTPAYTLARQYVTFWSCLSLFLILCGIVFGILKLFVL